MNLAQPQQHVKKSVFTSITSSITSFTNWKMMGILLVIIFFLFLGWYIYKKSANTTSSNANREGILNDSKTKTATLMLFYVDWCPHCKTAKPEWNDLKEQYDNKQINGYTLLFDEYNCTNESNEIHDLIKKYNIEGYPTIKLLKDNEVIEYDAKPTKETLEKFLTTVL
jgi:thiol-disulfide isomerase/thioredoxin